MPDFHILLQAESLGPWFRLTVTPSEELADIDLHAVVTLAGSDPVTIDAFEPIENGAWLAHAPIGVSSEEFAETDYDGVGVTLDLDISWTGGQSTQQFAGAFGGNEGEAAGFLTYIAELEQQA